MNLRHKGILAVIAFLMATTLGVAVAAHGTIIPIFLDSGVDVPADEECLTFEETGGDIFEWQACGGGGAPGGSDTEVQFNDSGAFGGDAELTYDKTTDILSVNTISSLAATNLILQTLPSVIDGVDGPSISMSPGDGGGSTLLAPAGTGGSMINESGDGGVGTGAQDGGSGGDIEYSAGGGGAQVDTGASGAGGDTDFQAGRGGSATTGDAGPGGSAVFRGGSGGSSIDGIGGNGGEIELRGGSGGESDTNDGGDGGGVILQVGTATGNGVGVLPGVISLRGDTYFSDVDNAPRNIYQGTDEEVTTTTLTDSGNLVVTLTESGTYKFKVVVFSLNDGATEGIKLSLGGTATAADIKAQVYIYDDTLNTLVAFARITSLGGAGIGAGLSAGAGFSVIEGTIEVADEGTFLLQFAQNATGASSGVHIEVNSSIEVLAIN